MGGFSFLFPLHSAEIKGDLVVIPGPLVLKAICPLLKDGCYMSLSPAGVIMVRKET